MKIGNQNVLIPTSMVGNYPNPRWWDAEFARHFTGDQQPPDSMWQEALDDVITALAHEQEAAGLDIIADGRVHGDNYADQAVYYYMRRLGYDLKGGHLGFPIYSRLHAGTLTFIILHSFLNTLPVEPAVVSKRLIFRSNNSKFGRIRNGIFSNIIPF